MVWRTEAKVLSEAAQKSVSAETHPEERGRPARARCAIRSGKRFLGRALRQLPKDLAQREGQGGRLGDIGAYADEARARRLRPEGVGLRAIVGEQHRRDLLQLVQNAHGVVAPDVRQGVVARGRSVWGQGIEEVDGLAVFGAKSRRGGPVFPLDVEHDRRSRPVQEVGDHDADALSRPRRRVEQDVFGAPEGQHPSTVLAEQDAVRRPQSLTEDLSSAREPRPPMQRPAQAGGDAQTDEGDDQTGCESSDLEPARKLRIGLEPPQPGGKARQVQPWSQLMQTGQRDHKRQGDPQQDRAQRGCHDQQPSHPGREG